MLDILPSSNILQQKLRAAVKTTRELLIEKHMNAKTQLQQCVA
jgi:hypothetical protein